MSTAKTNRYQQLVKGTKPKTTDTVQSAESELDTLLQRVEQDRRKQAIEAATATRKPDAIAALREQILRDLIPAFVELAEKYSKKGLALQMDAASFLQGGRELKFEFSLGDYRSQLHGTVTTEAIAFHEVRHGPSVQGELVSGPWLRLRGLTAERFRGFICERLALLVRTAAKGS